MRNTAGLCMAGGVVAAFTIRNPKRAPRPVATAHHCALDATPLRGNARLPGV